MRVSMRQSPTTYQVSDETKRLIAALGATLDLTRSDVLTLAVAELARREGLAIAAPDDQELRPARPAQVRVIADPPGPIPTKHNGS